MDRKTIYFGQLPLETDLLFAQQFGMIGLAKLSETILSQGTLVDGFTVTPTTPASLNVILTAGTIFEMENLEQSVWSSLPADLTHSILKQGIQLDPVTFGIIPPSTVGYSQVYLVQVQYQDLDTGSTELPYYNANNPQQNYEGPGNDGQAQNTIRKGAVFAQLKAGIAAATGTQAIPTPDAGYTGLFTITVANGASSISSGNIAVYSGAPFLQTNGKLPQIPFGVQSGTWVYGVDTGTVNALIANVTPAPTQLAPGLRVQIKVANTNTGPATLNLNGFGNIAIHRANGAALASGDINAGMVVDLIYDGSAFQVANFEGFTSSTTNNNTYNIGIPYANDTGAANALVATFTPAITSLSAGQTIEVKVANNNTGASTIAVNGLAAVPIVGLRGESLSVGALVAGQVALMVYNGTAFQLVFRPLGLRNVQVLTASGNYVPTPGATKALAFATGGGGGGGAGNGMANITAGSGGEGGCTSLAFVDLTGINSISCTIGAGGAGAANASSPFTQAGSGGQTSFGSYAIAPGGQGGWNSVGSQGPTGGGTGMTGATGLFIIPGNPGHLPFCSYDVVGPAVGDVNFQGGGGGSAFWGGAGMEAATPYTGGSYQEGAGGSGLGWGAGGAGANNAGGNGKQGVILVLEF